MLTLRHKIAQMLIMGFKGDKVAQQGMVGSWLKKDGLGGVILFDKDLASGKHGNNLRTTKQIKTLTQKLYQYADEGPLGGSQNPLLIAIDYEGGAVDRLAHVPNCPKTIPAYQQAMLSREAFVNEVTTMAHTLKSLGFNLNFAPVIDLNLNEKTGVIGALNRSFSADPKVVVQAARLFVDVFNKQGIVCTYKHFPGHGSALEDTHLYPVDVTDTFQPIELEPYNVLLQQKNDLAMVMTAHVMNRQLDESGLPATLSTSMLSHLLRQQIGFDGVIVSDDLQMRAVSEQYSLNELLTLTINAGADMLIFGNQWGAITAPEVIDAIEQLIYQGKIPIKKIEQSFDRISQLKKRVYLKSNH